MQRKEKSKRGREVEDAKENKHWEMWNKREIKLIVLGGIVW